MIVVFLDPKGTEVELEWLEDEECIRATPWRTACRSGWYEPVFRDASEIEEFLSKNLRFITTQEMKLPDGLLRKTTCYLAAYSSKPPASKYELYEFCKVVDQEV